MPIADPGSHSFDVTILKDKTSSDPAQVPASGATVKFLEPGATVSSSVEIPVTLYDEDPVPTTVAVYDASTLKFLDLLAVNSASTNQLRLVAEPLISTQISLVNLTTSAITLNAGDRLVRLAAPITLYKDRNLSTSLSNPVSTDSSGRARAYISAESFDYVASGTGVTTRAVADARGRHSPHWVNARAFPTLQAAVDYATTHQLDTVYIPAGIYHLSTTPAFVPPLLLPQNRQMRIIGDGPRSTILRNTYNTPSAYPQPPDADLIQVRGNYQTIEGLTLQGLIVFDPTYKAGIRIRRGLAGGPDGGNRICYGTRVRDVEIRSVTGWGIMIDDAPVSGDAQIAVWGMYENIEIDQESEGLGGVLVGTGNTTTQYFHRCNIKNFGTHAVHAKSDAAGLSFTNCIFEASNTAAEFIKLEGVNSAHFAHCHFEGRNVVSGTGFKPYVRINGSCGGVLLDSCSFTQKTDTGNMKAVYVESGARGISIRNPLFYLPGNSESGEGKHVIVEPPPSALSWEEFALQGGTLVDGVTTTPTIKVYDGSTDIPLGPSSRLRMPVLSATQITNLANKTIGDMVFNSDETMAQVWDGTAWQDLWEP